MRTLLKFELLGSHDSWLYQLAQDGLQRNCPGAAVIALVIQKNVTLRKRGNRLFLVYLISNLADCVTEAKAMLMRVSNVPPGGSTVMSLNGMTCIPEGKFWIVAKRSQTAQYYFNRRSYHIRDADVGNRLS